MARAAIGSPGPSALKHHLGPLVITTDAIAAHDALAAARMIRYAGHQFTPSLRHPIKPANFDGGVSSGSRSDARAFGFNPSGSPRLAITSAC
jgi:hypothetical protein